MRSHWARILRGTVAATLLVLGTGGLPHHHADHDGHLVHLDEQHGSHGALTGTTDAGMPTIVAHVLPTASLVRARVPEFDAPAARMSRPPSQVSRPIGPDPPDLLGARAPPPSSL